ncbi:alpha/beta fold hydrolase [Microbaculum marinum]|uniref:Alpha/beta fold hydrolase n=1 Tax=Microbaculum marinum TaxID=1764581 RepID=A0AAW9RPX0_9HYPH
MADVRLNHVIDGSGPNVLLLHPVGLDVTFLKPLADCLSDRYTVMRADMRGHGGTPTHRPATLDDLVDDIHGLIAERAFAPATVVGMSFGGMLAQSLAVAYPHDVSALVLSTTAATFTPETRAVMEERAVTAEKGGMEAVLQDTLQRWFTPSFLGEPIVERVRDRLLADDVAGWAQTWRAIATLDVAPRLDAIEVPTLCIAGSEDKATPPTSVRAIAERIPGAEYVEVAGAPHMLFLERPGEMARLAREFLDRTIGK